SPVAHRRRGGDRDVRGRRARWRDGGRVAETGGSGTAYRSMEGRHSAEPDPTVVKMVVAGSHAALAELYDRHAAAVFGASFRLLGQRLEAEEVVQETFLALWNRAEQFDPALGSLRAWLMTIARNRTIDRLRSSGRPPK